MTAIFRAVLVLVGLLVNVAFAASNQDVLDKLDEIEDYALIRHMQNQTRNISIAPSVNGAMSQRLKYLGATPSGADCYIDTKSIEKLKGEVISTILVTTADFPRYNQNKTYFSSMVSLFVSCNRAVGNNYAFTGASYNNQPWLQGEIVATDKKWTQFKPAKQGSIEQRAVEYICQGVN